MKIIDGNKRRNRTRKKKQTNKNKAKRTQKTTKQTFNAAKHAEFVVVVFPISAKNNKQNYHLMPSSIKLSLYNIINKTAIV